MYTFESTAVFLIVLVYFLKKISDIYLYIF